MILGIISILEIILGIISQSLGIIVSFSLDVYEIIIDLTEAPGRSRRHGAEKSGSTVLVRVHFIGLDYELSALFEKNRISTANCSKSALSSVRWMFHSKGAFVMEFMDI